MKILIAARFSPEIVEALRQKWEVDLQKDLRFLSEDELVTRLSGADVLITEGEIVTASVMDRCPDLKIIAACRGNPVNVDVDAATERGILVLHAPGRNAAAVADLTVALMLMCARHILPAWESLVSGEWHRSPRAWAYLTFQGIELGGRKVGFVGFGAIGQEVARRLLGFEMRMLAYDPYADPEKALSLGVEMTTLESLLQQSDFVSLHVPVTEETRGLIGTKQFGLMKPSAYLINTSRAAVLDETSMLNALREKRIAGAGMDVYHREPLSPDDPLTALDNVILTPHIAGATRDVVRHHSRIIYNDLQLIANGEPPVHVFNSDVMPSFLAHSGQFN